MSSLRALLAPALLASALLALVPACGGAPLDTTIDFVYDACAPLSVSLEGEISDAERRSLETALDMWNGAAGLRLTVGTGSGAALAAGTVVEIPLQFETAGPMTFGLYDDEAGLIVINRLLNDDGVRAVVIAHELGHAFGLPHVDQEARVSLMNPGNRTTGVQASDVEALQALWGACGGEEPAEG